MGSTFGCTVVSSGSDVTSEAGMLLLTAESLLVCFTASIFVRELFLVGSLIVPPLSASDLHVFDTRSGSFISSVMS